MITQCHQICRAEEDFRYRSGLLLVEPLAVSHQPGSGFDGAKFDGRGMQERMERMEMAGRWQGDGREFSVDEVLGVQQPAPPSRGCWPS